MEPPLSGDRLECQTDNKSPAVSIDQPAGFSRLLRRRRTCPACILAIALAASYPFSVVAVTPEIEMTAESLEYGGVRFEHLSVTRKADGALHSGARRVTLISSGRDFEDILFDGTIQMPSSDQPRLQIEGEIQAEGFAAELSSERTSDSFSARLTVNNQPLVSLAAIEEVPREIQWLSRGQFDLALAYSADKGNEPALTYRIGLRDLAFDSPQGRFAAEGLDAELSGKLQSETITRISVSGALQRGEVLIDSFYRDFSDASLDFSFEPAWLDSGIQLEAIRLTDHGALLFEGRAEIPVDSEIEDWLVEIQRLELAFPLAYQRYLEPVAAAWTLDGLAVTGRVNWSGDWNGGEFRSGDLEVTDLSVVDTERNRFAITGLESRLRPGDHSFDSRLTWRGLLFGRFNLGQGEIALDSEPGIVALSKPLVLDVMGGRLQFHELGFSLPGRQEGQAEEAGVVLQASLEELDMALLTSAMDWPAFSGKLSGEIPAVRLQDGVLEMDGQIQVNVFDGQVFMQDLRVERPFGVLPSLAANIELTNLDLEQLTRTFSFGQISGRLDGYVRELRMLDWRPVAFDAWLGTPQSQQEKNAISRQAVNHLTTIGGGQATTALTSPLLRMFNRFSYRRLGLGCRLADNTCEIRGIGEDDVSVLLLEGAGIPKITIRAFNRRVDWQQMVANLVAISGEESIRVGN